MREISHEQRIQIRRELLRQFHRLCVEKGLNYSLGYGSLLGAVRHSGMIPWDDDIDVVMPRKDYDKLSEIYKDSSCIDRYQVVNHRNHSELKTKISYFIDFTTIMTVGGKKNEYHGVHIDIYPVDILPDNEFKKKVVLAERKILHTIIRAKDVHPGLLRGKARLIRMAVKAVALPFSYDKALDRLNSLCVRYSNFTENRIAGCLVESGKAQLFPSSVVLKYRLYDYDGEQYYGFSDYDSPLKSWYGDYMTPPPEDKRILHESKWVRYHYKDENKEYQDDEPIKG